MKIGEMMRGRTVYYVDVESTVLETARYMVERNIGAVPVLREGEMVGIFSERDIMKRVVAGGRSPGSTKVSEVMTARPTVVEPGSTVEQCRFLMYEHGFRHLPVCDGKKLLGLLSLRDILLHDLKEKEDEVKQMRSYVSGNT